MIRLLWFRLVVVAVVAYVPYEAFGAVDVIRLEPDRHVSLRTTSNEAIDFFQDSNDATAADGSGGGHAGVMRMAVDDNNPFLHRSLQGMGSMMTMPPTAAPTACDPTQEVWLMLVDADSETRIGPLGDTIDLCQYGGIGLTIEALPTCKDFVKFKLLDEDGSVLVKAREGVAPFTLGEDEEEPVVDTFPVPELSVAGSYRLEVRSGPGATSKRQVFEFQVVDCPFRV